MTVKIEYPLVILSDLHIGHPASLLSDHKPVLPLLAGMNTVVFNGDTAELVSPENKKRGEDIVKQLRKACQTLGVTPVFLNGNHDPVISDSNHLDLLQKAVLVTHGDIIFHKTAPWRKEGEILGLARTRHLKNLSEDNLTRLEHHLAAAKKAYDNLTLTEITPPGKHRGRLAIFTRECFPPWRVLKILKFWADTPGRAECLLRMFRPWTRFIIIGHTHYQGVWHRAGRVIINTGSFSPVLGRSCVILDNNTLYIHKIVCKKGLFYRGRLTATHKISRLKPHEFF